MRHINATAAILALAMACTQAFAATERATNQHSLQTIDAKGLDQLQVTPDGLPGTPLQVAVIVNVSYSTRKHEPQPYYREADFQLTPEDLDQLRKTAGAAFGKTLFEPRGWQLATDPARADAQLVLELDEFWLAAPLRESIHVSKTYTEESARFTLKGRLEQQGRPLFDFNDKRRLRQLGMPPSRVQRFNVVTFWRDMRLDLERVAGALQSKLPAGKNGQAAANSAQ